MTVNNMHALIGNTPLLRLERLEKEEGILAKITAKLEFLNPTGSVKDRTAKAMLEAAISTGYLKKGGLVIEPTSGNTGIGLAFIAAQYGYRVMLTMPDTMSQERRALLKAYGAELVLTPGDKGMNGAIEKARQLHSEIPGSFMPNQFDNPANANIHEKTTGPELYQALRGDVDMFVAGVGTGGTITGVARFLKAQNPNIQIVAVEPSASPVLSGGSKGPHKIQGIGAGFVPNNYDASLVDTIVQVEDEAAFQMSARLSKTQGIFCGISSGAAVWAAVHMAKRTENSGKSIVVLLADGGGRYLSTGLF